MDTFDFVNPPPRRRQSWLPCFGRLLVFGFLAAICMILGFYMFNFWEADDFYNLFPPDTQVSPTETEVEVLPSELPTDTPEATEIFTLTPTSTATIEITATITAAFTSTATEVIPEGEFFVLLTGEPIPVPYPAGCTEMYIAGNAVNLSGEAAIGYVIELGGTLGGTALFTELAFTGSAPQHTESGFEIQIGDGPPQATTDTVFVQMHDADGNPVSDLILLSTFDNCDQNLIMLNFVQIR